MNARVRQAGRRLFRPLLRSYRVPIDRVVLPYLDELRHEFHSRIDELRSFVADEVEQLRRQHDDLGRELDNLVQDIRRIAPQVAAIEHRLAASTEPTVVLTASATEDLDEARSLVKEVRAEHAKIRARLTAMAVYEERIGRLEASVNGR
jgi:predicted  nucleic acid-binding Zn-ribbon protein